MRSSAVIAGVSFAAASQYNNLREDAKGASYLLAHEKSTPDMQVTVEAGEYYASGTKVSYAGGNTATLVAPVTNPRIDNLSINSSGVLVVTAGSENVSPETTKGETPAGNIGICEIYFPVGCTSIKDSDDGSNAYIQEDMRPFLQYVLASDELVKVGSGGTADYLNSTYFQQDGNHIRPADALVEIVDLTPTNDDIIQRKAGVWTNRTVAEYKTDLGLATIATSGSYNDLSSVPTYLTEIAALTPSNDDFIQLKSGSWENRTVAEVRTDLSITNVTDDAQMKREAGDMNTFSEKTAVVDADIVIIEDSEGSYAKKKMTRANFIGTTVVENLLTTAEAGENLTAGDICFIGYREYYSSMSLLSDTTYVDEANATTNYASASYDYVSKHSGQNKYTYYTIPSAISTPPAGYSLNNKLRLRINAKTVGTGMYARYRIYVLTSSYDYSTVTWNTKPTSSSASIDSSIISQDYTFYYLEFQLTAAEMANAVTYGIMLFPICRSSSSADCDIRIDGNATRISVGYIADDPKAWKATSLMSASTTSSNPLKANAVAQEAITAGNSGSLLLKGLDSNVSVSAGKTYFLGTAGATTTTPPAWKQQIGRELNGEFFFDPQPVEYTYTKFWAPYEQDTQETTQTTYFPILTYFQPSTTRFEVLTEGGFGSYVNMYTQGNFEYRGSTMLYARWLSVSYHTDGGSSPKNTGGANATYISCYYDSNSPVECRRLSMYSSFANEPHQVKMTDTTVAPGGHFYMNYKFNFYEE